VTRWAVAAAVVLAVAASQRVAAQSPGDTARLGDLVVTATHMATPQDSLPVATTVIHGDDLRARGIQLVLDALREVPGLAVVQAGSFGAQTSIFLRGGESDYVKVLLDGVPLNVPGGSINLANLTTADLDRIEIVRGPASVVYGADAMTGVIQLFTRGAAGGGRASVEAGGGTYASSNLVAHGDVAGRGWFLSGTGSRISSDGTYAFNSNYRNLAGSLQAGLDRGTNGRAALTVRYGDATAHFPTDGNGMPFDHNQFTTERSVAAGLDAWWPAGTDGTLHLSGFASRLNEGYTNRSDTPADTSGFDFVEDRSGVTWRRGADLRLDRHRGGGIVSLGAGLEHETDDDHDIGQSNFGFGISTDSSALSAARTTHDLYLQVLTDPGAKVSTQFGARLDDNSAFGTFTTWRAAATWHLNEQSRFWASAGTAFKAPTFSELFATSAYEVGNPALLPERTTSSEVGLETRTADHRLTVGATAFWQQFRDLIQYVSSAPGDPTYVNLGGASARGIEVTVRATLSNRVVLQAHWSWLHTEVTDTGSASSVSFQQGATLIRRPASSGGGTVAYRGHDVTAAATVMHSGSRGDVDFSGFPATRVILPGYTTVDLALTAPIHRQAVRSPGMTLTLRGENLFDAAYQQAFGFPGRGRTLFAGAGLQF
jgi:vitamin B12 transporter